MPDGKKNKPETISLDPTLSAREHLARKVVTWSIMGTMGIAAIVIISGYAAYYLSHFQYFKFKLPPITAESLQDNTLGVFHALLPVLGTWVGTVLAFYFSRENFVTAAATTQKLVGQLSDQKLQQAGARSVMIPFTRIMGLNMTKDMTEADITVESLRDMIKPHGARVPLLTRVPIFTHDRLVKYVIHQSTIYEFLAQQYLAKKTETAKAPTEEKKATLKDLIEHNDFREETQRFAFVPAYASLADAKAAMEKVDGCMDVFVTQNGGSNEPVLGWISNVEIARYSQT